ncbi:MAG TPA: hypothetical protein PLS04_18520, partial [Mycobacterium sp.]|nr:hypothetical protein [Mycobacterium sp.]
PMPVVDALTAGAQTVLYRAAPVGGALIEETALLDRWLAAPGTRIVRASTGWASPAAGAGHFGAWAATARSARLAAETIPETAAAQDFSERLAELRPGGQLLPRRAAVDGRRGA